MDPVFSKTIHEDGYEYYILPKNHRIFKASRESMDSMDLEPGRFYFFGVANDSQEYITSYEKEYGIIFEFETTRPYKLLAMDKPSTRATLYNSLTDKPDLKKILTENYGHNSGIRYSDSVKDKIFSNYICSQKFDGYAIHTMKTEFEGTFHPEFMICDTSSIRPVRRVSTAKVARKIWEGDKLNRLDHDMKQKRRRRTSTRNSPIAEDSPIMFSKSFKARSLFGKSPGASPRESLPGKLFDSPVMSNKSLGASPLNMKLFGGSSRKTKRRYKRKL
jgi:hypothetical protein